MEVGFRRDYLEEITAYLDRHSFDIVLLSVHNNGVLDYAETSFHEQSLDKCFLDYFSRLYEALISMDNYDVIAHLDYFLRYTSKKVTEEDFRRNRSLIYDILKTIIEKEKVLELNTAGLYRQGWIHPHPYVLNMYLDLGGRLFSLGSDAHQIEHYERGFDQAIDLLKSHGIYETVVFRNRRPYMVPI